jgi:hypothetical protein
MMPTEPKFDIVYHVHGISLQNHYCDECYGSCGCGGGLTWEQARDAIVQYHAARIDQWQEMTLAKWSKQDE